MADFVAVLRKTIGGLGENTPEMREKVYEKARSTIEAKLAALDPPPPAAVVERQRKALDDAIAVLRAEYGSPAAASRGETPDDVFASLKTMGDAAAKEQARPAAPAPRPSHQPPEERRRIEPAVQPPPPAPEAQSLPPAGEPALAADAPAIDGEQPPRIEQGVPPSGRRHPSPEGERRRGGLVVALLVLLLVLGGGAYALWLNKDDLLSLAGLAPGPAAVEPAGEAAAVAEDPEPAAPAEETEQEVAAAPPEAQTPPAPQPATPEAQKFTQRLMPDGTEVDEGPAGGPRSIGEGSSVASAAVPPRPADTGGAATDEAAEENETAAAEADEAGTLPAEPESEASAEQPASAPPPATQPSAPAAIAVGQRAIFYEERTSSTQGSAETGSIVWSVVRESPGGDLPPEPAIRAEATIPAKDVQLRMTIRRNGDETLPASHIVEMIFLTPDGFEGGAIANVARIAFKETEQAAGNPLIGIPAKIADGFFLIALGDAPAEIEANLTLLRRQSWVDIPIVYQSGRRALLSLEKGIPGDQVFEEALRAWSEASSG